MTLEQQPVEKRPTVLDNGLLNSLRVLTRNMVIRGGETQRIIVRDRPNIDYASLVTLLVVNDDGAQKEAAIELYASGWLGIYDEGLSVPIGTIEDQSAVDEVIQIIAMLTDENLARAVDQHESKCVFDKTPAEKEKDGVVDELQPLVDRYVEENRDRLTIEFTKKVRDALKRVMAQPLRSAVSS